MSEGAREMKRPGEAAAQRGGRGRFQTSRMQPAGASHGRREAVGALLDAAERLLVEQGYGAVSYTHLTLPTN